MRYWPMEQGFSLTSPFGPRDGDFHWGQDFGHDGGSGGLPVYAAQGGNVDHSGPASGFGYWICLDHTDADGSGYTVYGHIIPEVNQGTRVEAGQRIGHINPDSGTNGGVPPHLHFEYYRTTWMPSATRQGECLDPLPWLDGASYPNTETKGSLPLSTTIYGPDISHFQAGMNLTEVKAEGFAFVWAKVSEGDYYVDASWPAFRDAAKAAGLLLAGYHYVRGDVDADAQAQTFVDNIGDKSIPAMLDFEANSGDINQFWAVLHAIETRGVHVALSYIPRWYWMQIGQPYIGDVPGLIQSSYVSGSGYASALYPGDTSGNWNGFGGRNVDVLQFTDAAQIAGLSVDANAFRGTPEQLAAVLGLGGAAVVNSQPNAINDVAARDTWLGKRLIAGEFITPDGAGRRAEFEHGQVYWSPKTGAYAIPAELFTKFGELGWEAGVLGYPFADRTALPGGLVQGFQNGALYRKTGAAKAFWVHGAVYDLWSRLGYEGGGLGWPISDEIVWDKGSYQDFELGRVFWTPTKTLALTTVGTADTPLHDPQG